MKAIAINGSPRPGGNTEIMLKKVLEPLEAAGWNTEYRQIGGKPVRGCKACFKCFEKRNGRCVVEKDHMNDYLEQINAADAVILGSPTYVTDVTPELKALIDRVGDEEAMRNMRHLGQVIAWLGKAVASVPDAYPIPPYNVG